MTNSDTLSLTVLGCGTLGSCILSGVLSSLTNEKNGISAINSNDSIPKPSALPSEFNACVQRPQSAERLQKMLESYPSVKVFTKENVKGTSMGDVVLLGCKPYMCQDVLQAEGMQQALDGKLLISICAGVRISQLKDLVPKSTRVVRVMPNTASKIRQSMTVISAEETVSTEDMALVKWMMEQIGEALILPEKHMDACTALCGSGPAFYALILEAMSDGAVMMGLPRAEAQMMAANTMLGTAKMVLDGQHPAVIREQISSPGGCTIGGLLRLEDGNVRSSISRSLQEATNIAAGLGKK